MKRISKIISLLLSFSMCFCLCGCDELDNMKSEQAKYLSNGNVELNGYEYVTLDDEFWHDELDVDYSKSLFMTEKDVPVLLSGFLMKNVGYSNDEQTLIIVDDEYTTLYIRSDLKEEAQRQIENGIEYTRYVCEYYDYLEGETVTYDLSQEEMQIFGILMDKAYENKGEAPGDSIYQIGLNHKDERGLFGKELCTVCEEADGDYGIEVSYYTETTDYVDWHYGYITVPQEYKETVEKIVLTVTNI